MKKNILIIFLIMMFLPFGVQAYCTTEQKIKYNNLSANITYGYSYIEKDGEVSFIINLYNVHGELDIKDKDTGKIYEGVGSTLRDITISNLEDGQTYSFEVFSNNNECSYRTFNTIYVNLPKYNKYYLDRACAGNENKMVCQKWANLGNMSYDDFLNELKEKDEVTNTPSRSKEEKNIIYIIGDFWAKYYIYISGGIILVCLPIIIIYKKKENYDI